MSKHNRKISKLEISDEEEDDQVGNEKVICALSGGVDSSVLAHILYKAIKKNVL